MKEITELIQVDKLKTFVMMMNKNSIQIYFQTFVILMKNLSNDILHLLPL